MTYKPTKEDREAVMMMAGNGMDQGRIARVICGGIAINTLKRHFGEELATSAIKAEAKMGGAIYNKALKGDVKLMTYWMNCRAKGWNDKEEPTNNFNIIINGKDAGLL